MKTQMNETANFRYYDHILTNLDKAVIEQLGGECRNKDDGCEISENAVQELINVTRCSVGAAGGFNGFIYYSETVDFVMANREDIKAKLREDLKVGLYVGCSGIVSAVMSCLKTEDEQERAELEEEVAICLWGNPEAYKAEYTGLVANALAWAALEDLAFTLDWANG